MMTPDRELMGIVGMTMRPELLPFIALLQALGFEVGSIRGGLIGLDAERRYVALSFNDNRSRALAAFEIGKAVAELDLDKTLLGRAWDIETGDRFFLYWPNLWGAPL